MSFRYVWDVFQPDIYDYIWESPEDTLNDYLYLVNGKTNLDFDPNTGTFNLSTPLNGSETCYLSKDGLIYRIQIISAFEAYYTGVAKVFKSSTKTYLKKVSSSNENSYQNNQINGDYLYVLNGTDSIDPDNINFQLINNNKVLAYSKFFSKIIQIFINESIRIKYEGTIYYSVDYLINSNTEWENAILSTQNTLVQLKLPIQTKYFKVRVKASDSIGFTSNNYIATEKMELTDMKMKCSSSECSRKLLLTFIFTFIIKN